MSSFHDCLRGSLRQAPLFLMVLSFAFSTLFAQDIFATELDAKDAIRKLKHLPQWKHLDESIVDEIARVPRGGPRINLSVEAVSPDGKPIEGAIVVLFELSHALINSVYLSFERPDMRWLQLPLDISVTDEKGLTRRDNVRTSRHSQPRSPGRPGYAQVIALAIHPDWGWSAVPIATKSGPHSIKIVMLPTAKVTGKFLRLTPENQIDSLESAVCTIGSWSESTRASINSGDLGSIDSWGLDFVPRATIAMDGSFEWFGLPSSGSISLRFSSMKYELDRTEQTTQTYQLNGKPIEIALSPRGVKPVRIRVLDAETKEPISRCVIPRWNKTIETDEQGMAILDEYQIFGAPGTSDQHLSIYLYPTSQHFPVRNSFRLPNTNEVVEIELEKGVKVNGRVVDSLTKLGVQDVELLFSDGKDPTDMRDPFQKTPSLNVTTDIDGRFEVVVPRNTKHVYFPTIVFGYEVPLPPYMFETSRNQDYFKNILSTATPIDLTGKTSYEMEMSLRPAAPLKGVVLGVDGRPQADVEINASLTKLMNPYYFQTKTDRDGKFQVHVAPNLKHEISVVATIGKLRARQIVSYNSVGSFDSKPVVLKLAEKTSQQVLRGRVLVDDQPVKNVSVISHAYRPPANRSGGVTISYGPDTVLGTAMTDSDGWYSIELNDVDDQTAVVRIQSPEDLAMSSWTIRPVTLKEGEIRVPDMNFKSKYGDLTIRGEIITPEADPIQGATVSALPETRVELIRQNRGNQIDPRQNTLGISDEEGNFVCENLGEGKVQLQIRSGALSDFWSGQVFQSVTTTADSKGLIFIMDPKLSVPPKTIEPTMTIPLSLESIHQRDKPIGLPVTMSGRVVDEQDRGVEGATVFVVEATPMEDLPKINPFLHPLCGIETKTDQNGEFELVIPVNTYRIRLAMGKPGFQAGITDFLDPSKSLPTRTELKALKKGLTLTVVDTKRTPIANALVLKSQVFFDRPNLSEFVIDEQSTLQLSGTDGSIHFSDQRDIFMGQTMVVKPGYAVKLGRQGGKKEIMLTTGSGIEGRVVDEQGPVANYAVCCSTKYGRNIQQTKTDAQGWYRFEGITTWNDQKEEILLFGNPYARDQRGWFKTCMLNLPVDGTVVTLPDVQLDSCRLLTVHLNDAAGNPIKQKMTMRYRLRQSASLGRDTIELDGSNPNPLVGLPSEPLIVTLEVGRGKILDIQPTFQRVGFEGRSEIGLPMEQDIELYYTVHQ